ncbi:MAG: peptidase domain-containing ABC transporter [Rubrivivax sp.]|nr:MAG: peptidase domain-containing ABC transporter [Rubrivivax sp.]
MNDLFSLWPRQRVPVILQTEAAECGLASLAMVAGAHRHEIDLMTLRQRHPVSSRGANLARLMEVAQDLGMNTRAVRLELEELPQLKVPCILHWDLNHFVVLVRTDARGIVIHDPAMGERRLTYKEVSPHFTGVALELEPNAQFEKKKERVRLDLSVLFKGQRGLWRAFGQLLLLSLVLEVFGLIMPLLSQWLIDDVVVTHDQPLLAVLALSMFLLMTMATATRLVRGWVLMVTSQAWNLTSGANVFRHLLKLPLSYFQKRHTGDVLSRFEAVEQIQSTVSGNFVEALLDGLVGLVAVGMMLLYSPKLTMIVLAVAVLYAALRVAVFKPYWQASEERIVHAAHSQTFLFESLQGIAAIKFFSQPGWRVAGWMNRQVSVVNATVRLKRLDITYEGVLGLISAVEQALVVYLAAHMIFAHEMSIGMMVAFLAYKDQFLSRSGEFVNRLVSLRLLRLQGERLADIVLSDPEPERSTQENFMVRGDEPLTIELRDVSFRYSPDEAPILSNVNLKLTTGQVLAVVGPSGCGKSTLLKIMSGQVTPDTGEVLLNGTPIARIGHESFRRLLGTVLQDDHLFSGSVHDNIAMNDAEATPEKVAAAAMLAQVHDDIMRTPMGYQTLVGGMGATLSGGQKQRILLARALYKRPRFLLLDEYTSHLDFATEAAVQAAISQLPVGRFIITHRDLHLSPDDEIWEVNAGQLVLRSAGVPAVSGPAGS